MGLYGFADDPTATPSSYFRPSEGLFLIARRGPMSVGCGGIRHLEPGTAEIKRMYVISESRGTGAGRAIFQMLEDTAQRCDVRRIVLETGVGNHAALALYEGAGYTRAPS
ncbi:GNAT family N-acetyltransferase (plasmid) [Streptomyces microflavus]|uniref:GNAT family N-acetyltransferase n=1 Tax=Streptomyces microflavus TaxID=1919 RepID=UPI002E109BBE|nr:GNAT family N-acetyltransferase [Streptomyces microflavus]